MTSETRIKVRGYHLDVYGHVNNARYLEFLEEARWKWVEDNSSIEAFADAGLGFSVVNINIDYRKPALMGDVLVIETGVKKVNVRSAVIHQKVTIEGKSETATEADITFVIVSLKTGRPIELDEKTLSMMGVEMKG